MNSKRFYELIGICYLARKLSWGEKACIENIKSNTAKLIVISNDIGYSLQKKIIATSKIYKIPLIVVGTKLELGKAIGKHIVSIIVVNDIKLADKLKKIVEV
jgi:Ribosomal protein HS6-type (S12/L30/L7a)